MVTQLLGNTIFLGVASVAKQASKERFPIAVGMAKPQSKVGVQTELIIPPEAWGLLVPETEEEHEDKKKGKKKRQQILINFSEEEILKKGNSPEKASDIILKALEGQEIYSINREHDLQMLNKLSSDFLSKIKLLSTFGLANELVGSNKAGELELQYKLSMGLYPRNKADIRWIVSWIEQCASKGW